MSSPDQMKKCLEARMEQLAKEDICLTFSGGVSSGLFLRTAVDAAARVERKVYAITSDSRLYPPCDLEIVRRVTGELERIHEVIIVDELKQESIKNNPISRCYLCKHHLLSRSAELVEVGEIRYILNGTSEDDVHIYHPGIQAPKELGIISPLAELHVTKAQVKTLASEYGISAASHPSTPCMATRLPYDTALSYEVLRRIREEEAYVRTMVPSNVRLRPHGDTVRLELDSEAFEVLMRSRKEIVSRLKKMEFICIALDTEELRSGSVDTGLNGPEV